MTAAPTMTRSDHSRLMDRVYRRQRHIYDLTRKYYLLGRDRIIHGLDIGEGQSLLELGCGTGRNLAVVANHYPMTRLFGLDISSEMLATAHGKLAGLPHEVTLRELDASRFVPADFDEQAFDRIMISYALSMIPEWRRTVAAALEAVDEGGSLHIVDFGRQERLPGWFRTSLRAWLAKFHVSPRDSMREVLESECRRVGASLRFETLYRGYAVHAVITKR